MAAAEVGTVSAAEVVEVAVVVVEVVVVAGDAQT